MNWLSATHVVALALFYYAPYWWIKKDAGKFSEDPAADKFHRVWHRQRLTWRLAFAVVVALAASLPIHNPSFIIVSTLGLLAIGGGWYAYTFNPGLNVARQLDYVPKYYVSFSPDAAFFPDRWIANKLKKRIGMTANVAPHVASAMLQPEAGRCLKRLLDQLLALGVGVYLLSWVLLLWL